MLSLLVSSRNLNAVNCCAVTAFLRERAHHRWVSSSDEFPLHIWFFSSYLHDEWVLRWFFSPSSIWGQKNTYTIILPRSSQQFSERHYIGLRLVVSDMSMRFHDHLRQPCPPRVFFWKGRKKEFTRHLVKTHPGWYFSCIKGVSIIGVLQLHAHFFLVLLHLLMF